MNVKLFSWIWRVREIRFFVKYESCECKCRLNKTYAYAKYQLIGILVHVIVNTIRHEKLTST